ncbi:MAG: DUF1993 family protein [Sphingomonadaceae bacterium]|nr:DUF1993 family protein [Sphingomonadaceae bacterium]
MNTRDFTATTCDNLLASLAHMLTRAEGTSQGEALLGARLADDMFPFEQQVRIACNQVRIALNRVAGGSYPLAEEPLESFADAHLLVAQVRRELAASTGWLDDQTQVEFDLPNGMGFAMTAGEYVRDWTLPQFQFHVAMAYAILRHRGLPLGKADYVGYMMQHLKAPA